MLPPIFPVRFMREGASLKYKPFPRYPSWKEAWNIQDILTSVENLDLLMTSTAEAAAQAMQDAANALATAQAANSLASQSEFTRASFMGDEFNWTVGTPTYQVVSLYPFNYGAYSLTNGATALFSNLMDSGTWEINVLTYKGNNAGKLNITLDGASIVSNLDLYVSAAYQLYIHTLTGVVLTGDKLREWTFFVNGKNASSSNYGLLIHKVWGRKTGA